MVVDDDMDNIGMSERFVCMMGNIPAKYGLAGDFANGFFNRREAGAGQLLRDGKGFSYRYPACWLQEV